MSKKNKKNQKPELELSIPYATIIEHYCGDYWVSIRYESSLSQTVVETVSDAHYFAAKHGCKVWLDGEKVKAISSIAIARVREEEAEAAKKAKAEEDTRSEKIASMRDRPLTDDEIKELPELFWGGEWFGCIGLGFGAFFARPLLNGKCLVFAINGAYDPSHGEGVRLVNAPYERSTETRLRVLQVDGQPSRLNDDGHF